MKKLIIAEKPSVAREIANAIGTFKRENGYLENDEYVVSWCVGHLVRLANMDEYDESLKAWNLEQLPFTPSTWQTRIIDRTKDQFKVLEKLFKRHDVSSLICATDAGREGELIFYYVYEYLKCKKPVERLWISSFEDEVVRDGMAKLMNGTEKVNLLKSAKCRSQADFLVGINGTRLFTKKYGNGNILNVGRVQSPTLNMIVERDKSITNFIPKDYYVTKLNLGGFEASCRLDDKYITEQIKTSYTRSHAVIKSIETKNNIKKAPLLYDLTALQKVANKLFGYSAQDTLNIVQKLYESKLMTYPRTDSKYISSAQKSMMNELVQTLCENQARLLPTDFEVSQLVIDRVVDDSQVTDHHAILVTKTGATTDWNQLNSSEKNIMTLVAYQMLIAIDLPYQYQSTKVIVMIDGEPHEFSANTQNLVELGYRRLELKRQDVLNLTKKEKIETLLPPLQESQTLMIQEITVESKQTTPPQHFTESTLLELMENCQLEDDKELSHILKSVKGIGRSSTRANIIESIIRSGFVEREKKYLIATEKAHKLISILPPLLVSAKMTAEWEDKLDKIECGELSDSEFMNEIEHFVTTLVSQEKLTLADFQFENKTPQKEEIGKCPKCQSPIHESDKSFYCSNRDCKFSLWKEDKFFLSQSKKITKTIAKALLTKKEVSIKDLTSKKSGKTYSATIQVSFDDQYPKYTLVFPKK